MAKVNVYLNFNGNTEEAFNFYRSVFGGDFSLIMRFKDLPQGETPLPKEFEEKIMHISLPIGNGDILMGTDAVEGVGHKLTFGNNAHISITPDSKEEADKLYNGLSEGGKIDMPIADTFWGAYFGSFTDKFGVNWMINYEKK